MCQKSILFSILLVTLLSCAREDNSLSGNIELSGDMGTVLSREDMIDKDTLLLLVDDSSIEQVARSWYLTDLESDAFKVIFITQPEHFDQVIEIKKQNAIPWEIFSDRQSAFSPVRETPSYRFYKSGALRDKGSGLPADRYLVEWAVDAYRDPGQLIHNLGQQQVRLQKHKNDCAAAAVAMLLDRMRIPVAQENIYKELDNGPDGDQVSLLNIKNFLKSLGLEGEGWQGSTSDLIKEKSPVILHFDDRHFVVLSKAFEEGLLILDPSLGCQFLTHEQLKERWKGVYFRVEQI